MADRYHYLPSIGLAVMLAWGIPALIKSENLRKKILFPAGIIFLAIISFLSWNQCGYWKNSIELFSHALKVTDDNWLAYNNRGNAYADLGNDKQAIEDYNEAIRLKADSDRTYYDRGSIYVRHGQYQLAIEDFNKAIGLNPYFIQAYNNRGIAYTLMGIYQKALEDFNEAIILKSDHANSYNMRAFVYLNQGDNISGCRDARKACELGNCKTLEAAKGRGLCR
jgi:tetratricopeptide (TPR) repeat protein